MGAFLVAFEPAILIVHFVVAFGLMLIILLQSGKGGDIGSAFGAGGSQTLFGARGAATLLSKITTACAMIFLMTSLSLATTSKYSATGGSGTSIVADELAKDDGGAKDVTTDVNLIVPAPVAAPEAVEKKDQ